MENAAIYRKSTLCEHEISINDSKFYKWQHFSKSATSKKKVWKETKQAATENATIYRICMLWKMHFMRTWNFHKWQQIP